jgi:hypothetical protein
MLTEINRHPDTKTLRQFAGLWLLFFAAMGFWQGVAQQRGWLGLTLAMLAVIGFCGLVWPARVRRLYVGAMLMTWPLGYLVSHTLLAILFYGIFTPLGLLFRLAGRDALRLQGRGESTHWQKRAQPADVRRYFRPF